MSPLATDLAMWFLRTAVHVALLVGLVLLVERLLRGLLPPAWRYGLWCLVEGSRRLGARLVAIRDSRPSRAGEHLAGALAAVSVAALGLTGAAEAPAVQPAPPPTAVPAGPAVPEGLAGAAAEEAVARDFAQHPLVMVSGRFVDLEGSPTEVRQALEELGVPTPGAEPAASAPAVPLAPAEAEAMLAALNRRHRVDILSTPKVTTTNGTTAILRTVREEFFPKSWTVVERDGKPVAEPVFGEATGIGSVLEVLPRLDPSRPRHATLDLTARVTKVGDPPWREETLEHTDAAGHTVRLPVRYANVAVWSVRTSVDLPAGHSVLLGGGTSITPAAMTEMTPVLGRLPGVGRLFRHTRYEDVARARLLLVTLERVGTLPAPAP